MMGLTSSGLRLFVLLAGVLLAAGIVLLVITEQFDGFTSFGTTLICAVALAALVGMVLTWLKRAPVVAVAMNLFAILISALFVGGQVIVDTRTVRPLIATTERDISQIRDVAMPQIVIGEGETDVIPLLPTLDLLRRLHVRGMNIKANGSSLGFVDPDNLSNASTDAYYRGLSGLLLPRLTTRLENQIANAASDSDRLYDSFKVYLMLGEIGPMDPEFVRAFFAADLERQYPGPQFERSRNDLNRHVSQMLVRQLAPARLNAALVARTQQTLAQISVAQRIYRSILASPDATALPDFRLTDVGGPNVSRVFVRASGAPLNEGIPGIYTYQGFYQVFTAEALKTSSGALSDAFVYGQNSVFAGNEVPFEAIIGDVFDLYYADYIAAYDTLLGDIDILPLSDLRHTVEVTSVLSGGDSPILNILAAVAKETRLTVLPQPPGPNEPSRSLSLINEDLPQNVMKHPFYDVNTMTGRPVESHFTWLQDLVAVTRNEGSQVEAFVDQLRDVYQDLNRMEFAAGNVPSMNMAAFQQSAESYGDTPLNRWVRQIANGASERAGDNTRALLNAIWQAEVLPLCQAATAFNYPFQRDSASEIPINDFNALFAPGGLIDDFFNTHLADLVDRAPGGWSQRPDTLDDYVISATVLRQMQNATKIRNAFFANGGTRAAINFSVTPEALDPGANEMRFEFGASRAFFAHGDPLETTPMRWTGATSDPYVAFYPDTGKGPSEIGYVGPWALFRLIGSAEIRRTDAVDRSRLIFSVGGRIGIYMLHTPTFDNPFTLPALSEFECPQSL